MYSFESHKNTETFIPLLWDYIEIPYNLGDLTMDKFHPHI